jgi:hypothetical protein
MQHSNNLELCSTVLYMKVLFKSVGYSSSTFKNDQDLLLNMQLVTRAPLASWSNAMPLYVSVSNRSNFQLKRGSGTYLQLHQLVHHCTFVANEGDTFGSIVNDERSRVKSCVNSTGFLVPICIAHPNK